jgi:hypothetical protein
VAASASLQVVAQFLPAMRRLLGLAPVGLRELLGIGGIVVGSTVVNRLIGYLMDEDSGPNGPHVS